MDVGDPTTVTNAPNKIVIPSHRVPPEIIGEIVCELLPTEVDDDPRVRERLDVLLTVTGICRYWRRAALDHATLWSVVPVDYCNLGELFLRRSRNASLTVIFEATIGKSSRAHQAMISLLPHMQRVEKVHFRASAVVLDEIFLTLNRFMDGGQLKEVSVKDNGLHDYLKHTFNLDLLLEHASTLKVLRASVVGPGCRLPYHKLRHLPHLAHLEILTVYDIRDILPLLISLPALTSAKLWVSAMERRADNHRIALPTNIHHFHLQISDLALDYVLAALRIPTGVHFECKILPIDLPCSGTGEQGRRPLLDPEFFENVSHIEELRISLCSIFGSGPSGSFRLEAPIIGGFQFPLKDFPLVRKLIVEGWIERRSLEDVVRSAPGLLSVVFVNTAVIESRMLALRLLPSGRLDPDAFVKAASEERSRRDAWNLVDTVVNGTLEGGRLEEYKYLVRQHDEARSHTS